MKADQIIKLTGPAVLLNVLKGKKSPTLKGWTTLSLADMGPNYKAALLGNIGVSLGTVSEGLHTIDCDTDEGFQLILKINPCFNNTLLTNAARGGNIWFRIDGSCPKSGKLMDRELKAVGEWRGTGNQTIISGTHPSGCEYRNNGKKVISIQFCKIKWPDTWILPWIEKSEEKINLTSVHRHRSNQSTFSLKAIRALLHSIPPRPDYAQWIKIAAAVRHGVGNTDTAIKLLKEWSPEEKDGEYEELLKSPFSEITVASLVYLAREHGFSGVVRLFFYSGKSFCMESSEGGFVPLPTETSVRQHLTELGVPSDHQVKVLCSIREHQLVGYIGPVAGLRAGLHESNGDKILVTKGPIIIKGKRGDDTFVYNIFKSLLDERERPQQLNVFLDWLAHCRRAVKSGQRVQTPVTVFTGKPGNGKSLAIEIIKRCLGGRSSKAYRFFSGDSPFNADLVGSELLVIDDDAASKDHRSRTALTQNIKTNFYSGAFRLEGKHKDGIDCYPVHALVIAVNDDPEHLRVLPELDDTIKDKINLFKTQAAILPENADFSAISNHLTETLPSFLFTLDNRDLSSSYNDRKRLNCFWHPEVVAAVGCLSSEQQLLELIHQCGSITEDIKNNGSWVGVASELEGKLTEWGASTTSAARRLLHWPGACGTYLGRLAERAGSGVQIKGKSPDKVRRYIITEVGSRLFPTFINNPIIQQADLYKESLSR